MAYLAGLKNSAQDGLNDRQNLKKEEAMYSKPELVVLASACEAIQGQKVGQQADSINRLSPSAYEPDEG